MSEPKLFLSRLSILFADTAFFALAILLFFRRYEALPAPPFAVWAALVSAGLLVNTVILRKQGKINASVFFTAVLGAVAGAALIRHMSSQEISWKAACVIFILGACPVIHGGVLVHEKWDFRKMSVYMDGLVASTVFLSVMDCAGTFPHVRTYLLWTLLTLAITVFMLMTCRIQNGGIPGAAPVALFAGLCLFAWQAGIRLQKAALYIAGSCRDVGNFLLYLLRNAERVLQAFLNWLIRLFPLPREEVVLPDIQPEAIELPGILPEAEGFSMVLPAVILCLFVLVAAIWIRHRLRGLRWKAVSGGTTREQEPERSKGRGMLRKAAAALLGRLVFSLRYLLFRNSPEGLLTYTERKLGSRDSRRRIGESAPGFLRRIAPLLDEDGSRCACLLADTLERSYYGEGKAAMPAGTGRMYRKALKRMRA